MNVEVFNLKGDSVALFEDVGEFEVNQGKGLPLLYKITEQTPSPRSDDLTEIKSALGLPDDTPEPLVGVIWRLQQRVEDLEESLRLQGLEDGSIVRHKRRCHIA